MRVNGFVTDPLESGEALNTRKLKVAYRSFDGI